jgi:hypothetical protein
MSEEAGEEIQTKSKRTRFTTSVNGTDFVIKFEDGTRVTIKRARRKSGKTTLKIVGLRACVQLIEGK